jgi:hypothetical protein
MTSGNKEDKYRLWIRNVQNNPESVKYLLDKLEWHERTSVDTLYGRLIAIETLLVEVLHAIKNPTE